MRMTSPIWEYLLIDEKIKSFTDEVVSSDEIQDLVCIIGVKHFREENHQREVLLGGFWQHYRYLDTKSSHLHIAILEHLEKRSRVIW